MVVELDDVLLDGRMATRANLAGYHLQAAVSFARRVHDIESKNRDRPFDDAFLPMFWHASSSVIMSATALEASINEMIKDTTDDKSLPSDVIERYRKMFDHSGLKKLFDRSGLKKRHKESEVAAKYRLFACLREKALDETLPVYGSLGALIRFRNALVHFKPEWDYEAGKQREVEKALMGRCTPMPNTDFPLSYLTYSCAKWAVTTARDFSAQYAKLVEVPDKLAACSWLDLDLP